jgi:hypothetical protein
MANHSKASDRSIGSLVRLDSGDDKDDSGLFESLARSQSYKTFYGRHLQMFVIFYSACP